LLNTYGREKSLPLFFAFVKEVAMFQTVRDSEANWLSQTLLNANPKTTDKKWWQSNRKRYFNSIDFKFTDTSLGGDFTINGPPQFTRYADIRRSGRLAKNRTGGAGTGNTVTGSGDYYLLPPDFDYGKGMGSAYSEKINDNALNLYMCFGDVQYNSLTTFFTGFFNADAASFARRGRSNGILFTLGKTIGVITALPLAPILFSANAIRYLANKPATKFSFLKENMPKYWQAVNTIANGIAVNQNIIKRVFGEDDLLAYGGSDINPTSDMLKRYSQLYAEFYPGLFYENGGIDIFAVSNRASRIAERQTEEMYNAIEKGSDDVASIVSDYFANSTISDPGVRSAQRAVTYSDGTVGVTNSALDRYLLDYLATPMGQQASGDSASSAESMGRATAEFAADKYTGTKPGYYSKMLDFMDAERQDGSRFVGFKVENFNTVSESFSNTTRETDLASRFNNASNSARMTRVSLAEGNIADGGVGQIIGTALQGAKDLIQGIGAGLNISGLFAYLGDAYVDIPETHDRSTANLPSMSYNMELRSPHGNILALYQNIYVPLACILAAALPQSTGRHSYYAPFYCSAFMKGAAICRFGIVDSLTITRGVGNVGWNKNTNIAMAIDVSFSIKDLSSVMHMPIVAHNPFNPVDGVFDEDSAFNDYLAVLGGLGVNDLTQPFRRLGLSTTRKLVSYRKYTSPAFSAQQLIGNTIPGYIANALAVSQERP